MVYVQIVALGQGGQWRRALSIFQGLRLQRSLEIDCRQQPGGRAEALGKRSWSAIIAACYGNAQWGEVLELYREMRASGVQPDGYLMQKVISACEKVGAWEQADLVRCRGPFLLLSSHSMDILPIMMCLTKTGLSL